MSLKAVPFKSLGAVSYSPSTVTMAVARPVSVAVCDILSVKEWPDLENRVSVRSRSLEIALAYEFQYVSCLHTLSGHL